MAVLRTLVLALAAVSNVTPTVAAGVGANPIRKVVNMLQDMQKKVKEEGVAELKLYDKFMCYCQTQKADLEQAVANGKAQVEALIAGKESGDSAMKELQAQLKTHVASRDEAKAAIATATELRKNEAAAFAQVKSDTQQNLAGLKKAVAALEQGMGGSFIQTGAATALKKFAMEKADMTDSNRRELMAFLSGTQEQDEFDDAPASGEITGILKQMGDQMTDSLSEATATEDDALKAFAGLIKAKTTEVDTLQAQIEEEMMRVGEAGVGGATGANALEDTKEQVQDNLALIAALEKSCAEKTAEWEDTEKLRGEELLALADTVKILNSDETLEMFKKALPSASASFLQMQASSNSVRAQALAALRGVTHGNRKARPELDLISLALHGKQMGFEKVLGMIDDMIATLKKEQGDDDSKKEYCETQFDKADDKKKGLQLAITDSGTAVDELKGKITESSEEIKALEASIRKLDGSVDEATAQREAENADYKELTTNNAMAKEVLLFAKERLSKFYNPKSASFVQAAKQESGGVIGMIDTIIKECDAESQEAEVTEKNSQKNFENTIAASKTKRAEDSTSLTDLNAAKAEMEEALEAELGDQHGSRTSLMQTEEVIHNLHGECDWIMKNYDMRKEARTAEIDAISKAKAVLKGASYSFSQTGRRALRGQ